jgi:hypothetical protein
MVEKNKGEAPEAKTKKKSNTEPVQQGFGIPEKYIDRQVDIDDAVKKMQKREKTHGVIIVNSRNAVKPLTLPLATIILHGRMIAFIHAAMLLFLLFGITDKLSFL